MQIAYNSETIKAQIEQIKAVTHQLRSKDEHIKELINKKSYTWFYILIVMIIMGTLGWFYRKELIETYKTKIVDITEINKSRIKEITSTFEKEIRFKDKNIEELKANLNKTETAYTQSLKNIDVLHIKYIKKLEDKDRIHKAELLAMEQKQKQLSDIQNQQILKLTQKLSEEKAYIVEKPKYTPKVKTLQKYKTYSTPILDN